MARVVVVSHEATLTGAPRVAVEVVRALAGDHNVTCVLRAGGPLTSTFDHVAPGPVETEPLARPRALLRRARPLRRLVNRLDEVIAARTLRRTRPELLFLNTVKTNAYLRPALRRRIPVILHSHELGTLASSTLRRYPLGKRWHDVRLMACSTAARDTLADETGVDRAAITVVTSPVDTASFIDLGGSPKSSRVVGACGTVNERKGADLFVEVARKVDAEFRWIGQRKTAWPEDDAGVTWLGQVDRPYAELAALDVFVLPSREDAFPLVVLEAMALGKPIVAFDVGGVREQLGDTGLLVPVGDTNGMADAVEQLLAGPDLRARLGAAAKARAKELWDVGAFRDKVVAVTNDVLGATPRTKRPKVFLLKSWVAGKSREQRYRLEKIEDAGVELRYSDAADKRPWTLKPVKAVVRRLERLGAPFLQTLLATRTIARSDAVVAVFESQGNALAALRALRIWPFTRPRFVVVACWLAMDVPKFSAGRLRWYRWAYRRGVDRVVYFSPNQTEVYRNVLGLAPNQLADVAFGIDDEYFTPQDVAEEAYVLAVGRDKGRDWPTLFEAVRGTEIDLRVVCRPEDIAGLDVPENVTVLGTVDRSTYRDLTARAAVVVVATKPLAYPTGQSVTLESMALGKCCVVSDTPAMHDYLDHEVDALLVPPGDREALREALERATADADLRKRLGVAARQAVEARFNAAAMWKTIARLLGPDDVVPGRNG